MSITNQPKSSLFNLVRGMAVWSALLCMAQPSMAGTSAHQPNRENHSKGSGPALPGSVLPEAVPEEPRNPGKRAWMKAGMNNLKTATLIREQNKLDPSVVTLPSGLQYRVAKEGTGVTPKKSDAVEVYFQGQLADGKVFASASGQKPAKFKLSEVIPGWKQALLRMPVGSKWQLYVPPDLGYGLQGYAPDVGPDALLIYDLELVAIAPKPVKAKSVSQTPAADAVDAGEASPLR